jgi:hypothetical protein
LIYFRQPSVILIKIVAITEYHLASKCARRGEIGCRIGKDCYAA